jgi:hypothetical protein
MLEGHIFSYKEIRHHNLSKSSDAPIIYAAISECLRIVHMDNIRLTSLHKMKDGGEM